MSGDETFAERWSRRKQDAREAAAAPSAAAREAPAGPVEPPPGVNPPVTTPDPPKADDEFDLSTLPSLESLGKDSDYSMFMHKAVPDDLRLKALRRMWQTDPSMAGPDLLDMHAWDYTGNDGLRPLVAPVIQAVAAVAKELLDRSRAEPPVTGVPTAEPPAAESPGGESTPAPMPPDPPPHSRG